MNAYLLTQLSFATAVIGFIAANVLVFATRQKVFPNRLLGGAIFCIAFMMGHLSLVHSAMIVNFPHAFRLPLPFTYLIAPLSYLYVRTLLNVETHFRSYDWLHFLPFVLHAAELMPFYLQSIEQKQAWLEQVIDNQELIAQLKEGALPPYWHQYLKATIGLGYMAAQWTLLVRYWRNGHPEKAQLPRPMSAWLVLFTSLLTVIGLVVLITSAVHRFPVNTQLIITLVFAVICLPLFVLLFFRPSVLYGIEVTKTAVGSKPALELIPREQLLSEEDCAGYVRKIEHHFRTHHPFLRRRYALTDLVREIDIPRHLLSACINQHYGVNFNVVVNRFRIEYLIREVDSAKWEALSIDGVGKEVGFNTRTTFLKAFKENVGVTPSEYRQQLLDQPKSPK